MTKMRCELLRNWLLATSCLACGTTFAEITSPPASGPSATTSPPAASPAATSPAATDPPATPAEEEVQPAPPADPVLTLVEQAIDKTGRRFLNVDTHTPWQIMHGILALRKDFLLKQPDGAKISAVEWISNNPQFRGEAWFEATQYGGRAHPFSVPYAFEGHVNQFLAILAMSNLPLDHEFKVNGDRTVTMADMVRHAQMTVNSNEEITWTLWFLTQYVDQDAQWMNQNNQPWSMETLVQLQTRAPVYNAPCGGTHGLFAVAYARNSYLKKHGQLRGSWLAADQKIQQHIAAVQHLQNSDGSFSSNFFKGPGIAYEFNDRLKSSGHMLEWLMMALPQRRLSEEWLRRGVTAVANDLVNNSRQPADPGPLYHALHALVLYRSRIAPGVAQVAQATTDEGGGATSKPDPLPMPEKATITETPPMPTVVPAPRKGTPEPGSRPESPQLATPPKTDEMGDDEKKPTGVTPAAATSPTAAEPGATPETPGPGNSGKDAKSDGGTPKPAPQPSAPEPAGNVSVESDTPPLPPRDDPPAAPSK